MFDLALRHDLGFKSPSYHEIGIKYLKEEVKTYLFYKHTMMNEKKTDCTIMTDIGLIRKGQ